MTTLLWWPASRRAPSTNKEDLLDERGGFDRDTVAAVSAVACASGALGEAARWNCAATQRHAPYETLKVMGAWPLCLGDSVDPCLDPP